MSKYYLFPYQMIRKGSKVAIYGCGMVGIDYLNQLKANNYCEIVFLAAQNCKDVKFLEQRYCVKCFFPNIFGKRKDYDYVIIATDNDIYRSEMIKLLNSFDVENNKIVSIITNVNLPPFSQHGEEYIIYYAFKHMGFFKDGKIPTYIDVGAHDPYFISNTAFLHQIGCRGINVEANKELLEKFKKERPEDMNLCFGIGPQEGVFSFYKTDIAGLNTFKKENIDYNEFLNEHDTGKKVKFEIRDVVQVPVKKLDYVIDKYAQGKWPDFMSIDIEGMEYETLCNCNLSHGPKIIAVEVNYDGDLFIKMMDMKGYFPYIWFRENIIFIKKEYESLVHDHTER